MRATCIAAGRDESGIGMTTSIAPLRRVLRDRVGEALAQAQARLVDRDAVHDRVGTGEVDVLERARHELAGSVAHCFVCRCPSRSMKTASPGIDVAHDLEVAVLEHERLGGDDPLVAAVLGLARAEDQRTDAERVAEREQAVAGDERDRGVRALDALVHARDRLEDLLGVELDARDRGLQLVGEHVDQQLGVARGVEVPAVLVEQLVGELARVGEVAVVHEHDAVRRVHVEGLRLLLARRRPSSRSARGRGRCCRAARACRGCGTPRAPGPCALTMWKTPLPLGRRDAGGVLPAVLQQEQGVVDLLVDRLAADHSDDAAHASDGSSGGVVRASELDDPSSHTCACEPPEGCPMLS